MNRKIAVSIALGAAVLGTSMAGTAPAQATAPGSVAPAAIRLSIPQVSPQASLVQVTTRSKARLSPARIKADAVQITAVSPYKPGTVSYSKWYAKQYMWLRYKWGAAQFRALDFIYTHESGWLHRIANGGGSGAYGIPQALPGNKMAVMGSDWRTNPQTQIKWGLDYIKQVYRSPIGARSFWGSHSWY
ncbi:MAG: lytic transglycosylase domain-containing protein [Actinomycetes bacterium]